MDDGTGIKVEVYSRAAEVEIWVNGNSLGRKPAGKDHDFRAVWETEYVRGEVSAVGYDSEGKEISRDCIKSVGEPEAVDEDGNFVPYVQKTIIYRGRALAAVRVSAGKNGRKHIAKGGHSRKRCRPFM